MTASPVERARSFGSQAALYDRVRPGYPAAAVEAVLPQAATTVVDVGAGTGKLTAPLADRGLRVIAVEPDDAMRAVLSRRVPRAEVRTGTAEELPVGDSEADAVVFGQSWHWADHSRAPQQAARVLRPGGTLGLLWNADDDRVGWVAELHRLTGSSARLTEFDEPQPVAGFCGGHRVDVGWTHRLARADLLDLVRTWSAVSTLGDGERTAVLERVTGLLDSDPELAGQPVVAVPVVCVTLTYHVA